jgi:nucleoside-diphosphate-sugar epimerase
MAVLGTANDAAAFLLQPLVAFKPLVSRFAVCFVCQDHTYKTDKAARLLGYAPIYSKEEAFERTIASFRAYPG